MNSKRASSRDLAAMTPFEAASYWFVRQDAGDMTAEDQREFESWLEAGEAQRQAYEKVAATWRNLPALADEGELRALRVAALVAAPLPKVWPRAAAIAAGVLAVAGLGAMIWRAPLLDVTRHSAVFESKSPRAGVAQYRTAHNQRSTVTLPDGTQVSMNLDTAFEIDFSPEKRLIHLTRGQAFFEVAQDSRRPFIVAAADRHIRALGTQFDVRLDTNRVEVVLLEGRVSVEQSGASLLDTLLQRSSRVELAPGQRLVASAGKPPSIAPTNAARETSWREGWIIFEDETVEQAVAELNRYSERPLVVQDEAVRNMRFSGVFRIGQPDRFGAMLQELLPVAIEHGAEGESRLVLRSGTDSRQP